MSNGSITTTGAASHGVDVTYGGAVTLNNVNVSTALGSACAALSTDYGGGTVTVTGGTMTTAGSGAPGIYSTGVISVTGATITATGEGGGVIDGANSIALTNTSLTAITPSTGNLMTATVASVVTLTLDGEKLVGNLFTDSGSSIAATIQNSTSLTGAINNAALTIDSTSTWSVTANSVLTALTDATGVSGTSITNIQGNGFTVTYDATLAGNSYLGGKTYTLAGGGILTPAGSTVTAAPAVVTAGIVNGASFAVGVAPGAWTTIFGTNLATSTAVASASNLVNGYLPTTLGGASLTINGKAAYLVYASPTQLNFGAPSDSASGTVLVEVTTTAGTATAVTTLHTVLPAFFTSGTYVAAVRPSDGTIINGTVAARPGDVLELFATGLGATTTAVSPGLVFSGAYATSATPTVTIGGTAAQVSYAGLVGAGLYQINVAVPATLATGTYPVIVTQSGTSSPSSAMLNVAAN